MGVFDDDRDLGEHGLETDVEILDLIRGEVVVLEHLDCVLGHPVGFQGQESLGSLCSICRSIDLRLISIKTKPLNIYQISNKQTLQLMFDKRTETPTTEETESYQTDLTDTIQHVGDQH